MAGCAGAAGAEPFAPGGDQGAGAGRAGPAAGCGRVRPVRIRDGGAIQREGLGLSVRLAGPDQPPVAGLLLGGRQAHRPGGLPVCFWSGRPRPAPRRRSRRRPRRQGVPMPRYAAGNRRWSTAATRPGSRRGGTGRSIPTTGWSRRRSSGSGSWRRWRCKRPNRPSLWPAPSNGSPRRRRSSRNSEPRWSGCGMRRPHPTPIASACSAAWSSR